MVPVYVSYSGIEEHNIEARPRNIPITIENRVSQEYTIAVNTGDTKPEKGYEVGKNGNKSRPCDNHRTRIDYE